MARQAENYLNDQTEHTRDRPARARMRAGRSGSVAGMIHSSIG